MSKVYLTASCPVCGKRIFLNSHGYQCEGCTFHISNFICNRRMTTQEVEKILRSEKIILDGFSTNAGRIFSSIPVIDGNEVRLDNTVSYRPGIGRVIVGTRTFVCASQNGQPKSKFNVSSTNSEQSKLCVNSPLYIDTRLLWKQAIGSNCP